jgi:hypothetical protein
LFHPVSTPGTGTVEGRVSVQECLRKEQAVQPNPDAKLLHKQFQDMISKPAERLDDYITVNRKIYRVLELFGKGGSSKVFKVS